MATVALTHVGGRVGRRLVAALDTADHVGRIVGIDTTLPTGLSSLGLDLRRVGPTDRGRLATALRGVDMVVHLGLHLDAPSTRPAASGPPARDGGGQRGDGVVEEARTLIEVAHEAGVRRILHVSSRLVYGAHPDNPLPIGEDQALRPNTPYARAERAAEVERWLAGWAADHPDTEVTILRPSMVGPGVDNLVARQLDGLRVLAVKGFRPPVQLLHIDDLAAAVVHAVDRRLTGTYNVTAEGWLSFDELVAISGRRVLEVPEEIAFSVAERVWRLGVGEAAVGRLPYLMHPVVLDAERLIATGWRPRHSNRDVLAAMVAEHGDRLVVGPVVTTRARAATVTAGVGVSALAAAAWGMSRARQRRR